MLGEQRDVVGALAQCRQADRNHVDPIVEILPELPVGDHLAEIAVGGRDDADVGLDLVGAPHPPELPFLQDPQDLHLQHRAHLADFVEEDRALVGDLDQALPVRVGAGERSAHVAEQLRIEQRLRQRPAVDRHERPLAARAIGRGSRAPPVPCPSPTRR